MLRGRWPPNRRRRIRLTFSFGSGGLCQHRPRELARLGHREACPPGTLAAETLPKVDEDPHGGMAGVTQSESADRKLPPAACV